jgi:hypothetical protein
MMSSIEGLTKTCEPILVLVKNQLSIMYSLCEDLHVFLRPELNSCVT